PFDGCEHLDLVPPEPGIDPYYRPAMEFRKQLAAHGPVVFWGFGPDDLLRFPFRPHMSALFERRRYARGLVDLTRYLAAYGGVPRRVFAASWNRMWAPDVEKNARFARPEPAAGVHPKRARGDGGVHDRQVAWEAVRSPFWSFVMESTDPGATLVP